MDSDGLKNSNHSCDFHSTTSTPSPKTEERRLQTKLFTPFPKMNMKEKKKEEKTNNTEPPVCPSKTPKSHESPNYLSTKITINTKSRFFVHVKHTDAHKTTAILLVSHQTPKYFVPSIFPCKM